ncbi:MAG: anti-sigma F factor [Clostridia bacterium]|nr:anti-sigma F factor [Clostridia bacterium]
MNKMFLRVSAISCNESFVRTCVAAFMLGADPTIEEINDVKTAVSEAVTNSIVHAYPDGGGEITIECELTEDYIKIIISDFGIGIESVEKALTPFFTTKGDEERSGLGFTIIKSFMDEFSIESKVSVGTTLTLTKRIA